MRTVLLFLGFLIVLGSAVQAAPAEKQMGKAVEIPLKARNVPKQVLPFINLSRNKKISTSYSFFNAVTKRTVWLVFTQEKTSKPAEPVTLNVVEGQKKKGNYSYRQITVFKSVRIGRQIRLFWLNSRTRKGFALQTQPDIFFVYAFPSGFETKDMISQGFYKAGEGGAVTDFFVNQADGRGFLKVTESTGMLNDFGVQHSSNIDWTWTGRGWIADSENVNVLN